MECTACSKGCTPRSRPLTHLVCVICALFGLGEKWEVAEGNCCCTTSPFSLSHLRAKADERRLAAEKPNQPRCIIQFLGWKIIHRPLTVLQASKLKDSASCLIERRAEPLVASTRVIPCAQRVAYSALMHHVYAGKGGQHQQFFS